MTTALVAPLLELVVVGAVLLALIRRFALILLLAAGLLALVLAVQAVATITSNGVRSDPVSEQYVADSGVFLDGRSNTECRAAMDARYLDDPVVTLVVHVAVLSEISGGNDRNGTQTGRLGNLPGRARLVPAATPAPPDVDQMVSRSLGRVDIQVLETALQYGMPVLTTNAALKRQVTADPQRAAARRYGALKFFDACTGTPL